jgi:hypothetical protein
MLPGELARIQSGLHGPLQQLGQGSFMQCSVQQRKLASWGLVNALSFGQLSTSLISSLIGVSLWTQELPFLCSLKARPAPPCGPALAGQPIPCQGKSSFTCPSMGRHSARPFCWPLGSSPLFEWFFYITMGYWLIWLAISWLTT